MSRFTQQARSGPAKGCVRVFTIASWVANFNGKISRAGLVRGKVPGAFRHWKLFLEIIVPSGKRLPTPWSVAAVWRGAAPGLKNRGLMWGLYFRFFVSRPWLG